MTKDTAASPEASGVALLDRLAEGRRALERVGCRAARVPIPYIGFESPRGRARTRVPSCDDVRTVTPAVLRHRLVTNFQAEAEGRTSSDLVEELIDTSRKWT